MHADPSVFAAMGTDALELMREVVERKCAQLDHCCLDHECARAYSSCARAYVHWYADGVSAELQNNDK
jgi:hypothetical protein